MSSQRSILEVAARQHGVFSRQQLAEAHFSSDAIRRRLDSGDWIQLDHRVYAVASSAQTWERRLSAAILSRPRAVLTHTTAARLIGLHDFELKLPAILVPRTSNARSELARIYETDEFEQISVTRVDGFEVTTVPETLLVLARDLPADRIEPIFDRALTMGQLDLKAMIRILDREARRRPRGIVTIRQLTKTRLPSAPTPGSTFLEALLENVLTEAKTPPWTREYQFRLTKLDARVDVYIPTWRLAVEGDSRNWHTRNADFESDRRRDNALAAVGIQVLRYTYDALANHRDEVIREIEVVGAVRSAQRVG